MGSGLAGLCLKSTQGPVEYSLGIGQLWEGQSLQGQPGQRSEHQTQKTKARSPCPSSVSPGAFLRSVCPRVQFPMVAGLDPCPILIRGIVE